MSNALPITERCKVLLLKWLDDLVLTNLERSQLKNDLKALTEQIDRLTKKRLRISVFGRVGVGKSSLLNALLQKKFFSEDITHGSTSYSQGTIWDQKTINLNSVELIDTPGIDEVNQINRKHQTSKICNQSDLILFVIDGDLTTVELTSLQSLIESGKPIILVLNRCDQWQHDEIHQLKKTIRTRLPRNAKHLILQTVSAAPRQSKLIENGKVRSVKCNPEIEALRVTLTTLLNRQGELFLALNSLRCADEFYQSLKKGRLQRGKLAAQGLIGKFAALKASGVAASPVLMIDITAGLACDTALVIELSKLYGLQLQGHAARELLKRLSLYNALLGGTQFSIQFGLSLIRHILLLTSPLTGGASLIPATPIALAQAALAVHTTKLTGRLAAQEFLKGSHRRGFQPRMMLYRLAKKDPEVKLLLNQWHTSIAMPAKNNEFQALLP